MIPEIKKNLSNERLSAIKLMILVLLGCFAIPLTLNASTWTDNFDSYDLGDFYGNGNWFVSTSSTLYIINNSPDPQSYPQALEFSKQTETKTRFFYKDLGYNVSSSIFKYYYNAPFDYASSSCGGISSCAIWIRGFNIYGAECFENFLFTPTNYYTLRNIVVDSTGIFILNEAIIPTGWLSAKIEWNAVGTSSINIRYKFNEGYWSEWRQGLCQYGISKIGIADVHDFDSQNFYIFFDSFSQGAGYGLCGKNLDCIFCNSLTECENNDCFWIENATSMGFANSCVPAQPYIEEYASDTFNATTFYQASCNYSTPTGLFLSLSNVSGGVFSYLSSWLSHFTNYFDLSQAQEKGIQYGQAIPKMRGYIGIFNNLFGDLPIGEVFIFYILVFLAIIIFRIARHIKQLLPFQ